MMTTQNSTIYDYDLFVIGAGSGGLRASRTAADLGANVAICEERYLGGTCVNAGCVPKKLFMFASQFSEAFQAASGFGWSVKETAFNWTTLRDNKTKEIQRLNTVYENLLAKSNVDVINGRAVIADAHTVLVGDKSYTAERILLAVGGWPMIPDLPGKEHICTSNDVFDMQTFPKRVIVLGGGYIALEFASIFNGLGAETHLLYRGELFMGGFDHDVRTFMATEMEKKGVNLHFETNIASITKLDSGELKATMENGSSMVVDYILYATGRQPKTEQLGLENTAVELAANGSIVVNDHFQTAEPSIYAVGDVIDSVQLTPVALAEGMALAQHLFGEQSQPMDYDFIPTTVFASPNIAMVGYTESKAKEIFESIAVYKTEFKHMKHTLSGINERTFMKLVVDKETDRVIGLHMVGSDAGEILQGFTVAIKAGATKADFDQTIGIHPTAAEEFVTMRQPA